MNVICITTEMSRVHMTDTKHNHQYDRPESLAPQG
jgi:hypothetical protein